MTQKLRLDTKYLKGYVSSGDIKNIFPEVEKAHFLLTNGTGEGANLRGWLNFPEEISEKLIKDIEKSAAKLRANSDVIIVIGIGGSYLGVRAIIETLSDPFFSKRKVYFAGHNLSGEYLDGLLKSLGDKNVGVIVISKSGTTTEPAVAFRIIQDFLRSKYTPSKIRERVVCITDKKKGALRMIADRERYKSFEIPGDIGGRFSVLTPVGLFPAACEEIDIRELIEGAKAQQKESLECDLSENISCKYAAIRNVLYRKGKKIEVLASFNNRLHYADEWWKQLFAESEGKNGHSIFPASCDFSTDLHSVGQLIQQGERNLFETFLVVEKEPETKPIPWDNDNMDGLNYLADKQLGYINRKAYEATAEAHFEGGVPNSTIFLSQKTGFSLGQLFYFFEKAVAISAYLSGVNPFDQPGVEAYKQKMFKLLGKP
ncbi:MAG: glucose-6-phosphate isomerase [Candidatus Omnitrophota bacterium]